MYKGRGKKKEGEKYIHVFWKETIENESVFVRILEICLCTGDDPCRGAGAQPGISHCRPGTLCAGEPVDKAGGCCGMHSAGYVLPEKNGKKAADSFLSNSMRAFAGDSVAGPACHERRHVCENIWCGLHLHSAYVLGHKSYCGLVWNRHRSTAGGNRADGAAADGVCIFQGVCRKKGQG